MSDARIGMPGSSDDPDRQRGLYQKFDVRRTDPVAQERHGECEYFVLDIWHDALALPALEAYTKAARDAGYVALADDLAMKIAGVDGGGRVSAIKTAFSVRGAAVSDEGVITFPQLATDYPGRVVGFVKCDSCGRRYEFEIAPTSRFVLPVTVGGWTIAWGVVRTRIDVQCGHCRIRAAEGVR